MGTVPVTVMMKSVIMRNSLVYAIAICLFSVSMAFCGQSDPPIDLVKKYCTQDLRGARLGGANAGLYEKLTDWEGEPGWDSAFVVDKIDYLGTRLTNENEIFVDVKFDVICILAWDGIINYSFMELITFKLLKKDGAWVIKSPIYLPHISVGTAVEHIEGLIKTQGTKKNIPQYKKTISMLEILNKIHIEQQQGQ